MTVEWQDSRWPRGIAAALRLISKSVADQGTLRIEVEEPRALGRLILEDGAGKVRYALVDSIKTRKKWFYVPAQAAENGMVLKNEAGETLFALPGSGNAESPHPPARPTQNAGSASEEALESPESPDVPAIKTAPLENGAQTSVSSTEEQGGMEA